MKKVYITREIPEVGIKMLKDAGCEVVMGKSKIPPTQKDLMRALKGKNYDAVITLLTDKIDAKIFDITPTTKIFANYAVGYDNLDLAEATKRGIHITNTPGDYVRTVADHTLFILFALMSKIVEADKFVRQGKYKGWDPMLFIGDDLVGKTIAIIGTGKIGEQVAQKLHSFFDAKIIYYDVNRNERIEQNCNAEFVPSIDEALKRADVVSLHVPLLPTTQHLINKERLALMKPTAYLINTSRGPVVDENALVDALKKGIIKGAGLDVFEFEPKFAKGLLKLSNTVLTPHIGSAQISARDDMSRIAAENVIDALEGREPRNKVNK